MNREDYKNSIDILNRWAYAYYVEDNPIATDEEYDRLYHKVLEYERENPDDILSNSPTKRVGGVVRDEFKKAKHIKRMWSMEDVFTKDEVQEWLTRVTKSVGDVELFCEPKFDGASMNLLYRDGELVSAITRGDGVVGEEVIENVKTIRSVPLNIDCRELIEIRGEVVIPKDDFEIINRERVKEGKTPFANPRNASAGSLRVLDSSTTAKRRLAFYPWGLGENSLLLHKKEVLRESRYQKLKRVRGKSRYKQLKIKRAGKKSVHKEVKEKKVSKYKSFKIDRNQRFIDRKKRFRISKINFLSEKMDFIYSLGFLKLPYIKECKALDEIEEFYNFLISKRDDIPVMMDGMVIKVDNIEKEEQLGYTVKYPKWMCAYKFPALEKVTKIEGVTLQVGRTGVITPVAEVEAVDVDGATVRRVTLHNFDDIERKEVKVGDSVIIIRSGDVIPKIVKVLKDRRDGTEKDIERPTHCPTCKSELLDEGTLIKCQNISCPDRVINSIIHFSKKGSMGIDGLGSKIAEQLVREGKIENILELYSLKSEDLEDLDGFKSRKIEKLLNSIETTKGKPLKNLINAMGIEHIGEVASSIIASKFGLNFINATKEELIEIDGIGEEMANSFLEFISVNRDSLLKLIDTVKPVTEETPKDDEVEESPFRDKRVVLTGTMSESRSKIKGILEEVGAKVTGSVSKKTDYLIYGESAGSKYDKAVKLGVKILTEDEMRELLKG